MFGWNLIFPTTIVKLLWRISALVVLCTAAAFSLWELAWGIFRAVYLLYLNKTPIRPKSIYYVYAYKFDKIAGANGLPIHNKQIDAELVSFWHLLIVGPLVILYFFARLYINAEALASLRALPSGSFEDIDWTSFILHY